MRQSEFDQAQAVAEEAAAAGAFTENQLKNFIAMVAAAQESDAALRQLGEAIDDGFTLYKIAEYLGDLESTLATAICYLSAEMTPALQPSPCAKPMPQVADA